MNKAIIMGRLTKQPELAHTQNDKSVCSFTLAVDRRTADKQTDFIDFVAWGKTAEFVTKWFNKGQMMAVVGRIQTRTWTNKEGQNRKATEVVVDEVHFCGRESKNDGFVELDDDEADLPF